MIRNATLFSNGSWEKRTGYAHFYFHNSSVLPLESKLTRFDTGEAIQGFTGYDEEVTFLFNTYYVLDAIGCWFLDYTSDNQYYTPADVVHYNLEGGGCGAIYYINQDNNGDIIWPTFIKYSPGMTPPKDIPLYPAGFPWTTTEGPIDLRSILGVGGSNYKIYKEICACNSRRWRVAA